MQSRLARAEEGCAGQRKRGAGEGESGRGREAGKERRSGHFASVILHKNTILFLCIKQKMGKFEKMRKRGCIFIQVCVIIMHDSPYFLPKGVRAYALILI